MPKQLLLGPSSAGSGSNPSTDTHFLYGFTSAFNAVAVEYRTYGTVTGYAKLNTYQWNTSDESLGELIHSNDDPSSCTALTWSVHAIITPFSLMQGESYFLGFNPSAQSVITGSSTGNRRLKTSTYSSFVAPSTVGTGWTSGSYNGNITLYGWPRPEITELADFGPSDTGVTITGTNFMDATDTLRVYLSSSFVWGSGTISEQDVTSHSDSSATINVVKGDVPNGYAWVFVKTALNQVSRPWLIKFGTMPIKPPILYVGATLVDSTPRLYESYNNGETWSENAGYNTLIDAVGGASPVNYTPTDVCRVTKNIVILITHYGHIIRTINGGKSWSVMDQISTNFGYRNTLINWGDGNLLAVMCATGASEYIKVSDDYGETWSTVLTADIDGGASIGLDPGCAILFDYIYWYHTTDYGQTWTQVSSGLSKTLMSCQGATRLGKIFSLIDDASVVKYTTNNGISWTSLSKYCDSYTEGNGLVDTLDRIWFANGELASNYRTVHLSEDEGETWSTNSTVIQNSDRLTRFWEGYNSRVFASADDYGLYYTDDGISWTKIPMDGSDGAFESGTELLRGGGGGAFSFEIRMAFFGRFIF